MLRFLGKEQCRGSGLLGLTEEGTGSLDSGPSVFVYKGCGSERSTKPSVLICPKYIFED